jgi:NhaP-type Na+/H+ or K+/H+ antiporter
MLKIVAILLTLTAAFSYLNHRYLNWPMTIGVMAIALAVSLALSLPPVPERNLILMLSYSVVVFSILVRGLTVGRLVVPRA